MIRFADSNCSITLKDCQVEAIRSCLTVLLGETQIILRYENFSPEGKKQLEELKSQIFKINDILNGQGKSEGESSES